MQGIGVRKTIRMVASNGQGSGGLSRRDFIAGAVSMAVASGSSFQEPFSAHAAGRDSGVATPAALTIIDTHTHFFDSARAIPVGRDRPIPWPPQQSPLFKPTLPPDWEVLAKPLGMSGTVVVEATSWLEDNDWILVLAERHRSIVGLIGNLSGTAVEQGAAVPVWNDMARFKKEVRRLSRNPIFRGIRVGGSLVSGDLSGGRYPHFELLADAGMVIDVLGVNAADLVALANVVPSLTIVVDHMFNIKGAASPSAQWRSDITALAGAKNVVMKVSGLVEGLDTPQTDAASALALCRHALDHVYQTFGPDRLVFGTNWPVSQPQGEMSVVKGIAYRYFEPKGKEVLAKVFAGNAKRIYRYVDQLDSAGLE